MKCENCQIETNNTSDKCPLCGRLLSGNHNGNRDVYPKIEDRPIRANAKWLKKIILGESKFISGVKRWLRF